MSGECKFFADVRTVKADFDRRFPQEVVIRQARQLGEALSRSGQDIYTGQQSVPEDKSTITYLLKKKAPGFILGLSNKYSAADNISTLLLGRGITSSDQVSDRRRVYAGASLGTALLVPEAGVALSIAEIALDNLRRIQQKSRNSLPRAQTVFESDGK